MYEKKQGAERLIYALYNRKEDIETVARMAVTLDYVPSQLHEDWDLSLSRQSSVS